jgi:hypothetical protein
MLRTPSPLYLQTVGLDTIVSFCGDSPLILNIWRYRLEYGHSSRNVIGVFSRLFSHLLRPSPATLEVRSEKWKHHKWPIAEYALHLNGTRSPSKLIRL